MTFVVWLDERSEAYARGGTPYEDEDKYQFLYDGVLKIVKKADNSMRYYAPGVWHSVETKNDHNPEPTARWPIRLPGMR